MKILSFAASNSRHSINRKLLDYTETLLPEFEFEHLDLNDYEMPIYSIDREHEAGIPDQAGQFLQALAGADALMISFAEHNGNYTVAFKNVLDWCSRLDRNIYQHKKMLLLSTSPGQGGGSNVLAMAAGAAKFFAGEVVTTLSIPSFYENFDEAHEVLTHTALAQELSDAVRQFRDAIS
ncbi:NADPH-dependent FMN reductase [Pseudomaricurvus sp. HS19]|uniref:NADPH-dependent FMN reductase n=1 Tax=Pseudomaricurvus sp. HS19 TaxID=2692626 RepID=UPI00136F3AE2|nr:NAD(P)H-dependent oxidoreductase [Pseudomaricurvus sp. HS19]MYM61901.1 NADPH-dependent FMN reductase [Pseudomaricurvus sp. HS19]